MTIYCICVVGRLSFSGCHILNPMRQMGTMFFLFFFIIHSQLRHVLQLKGRSAHWQLFTDNNSNKVLFLLTLAVFYVHRQFRGAQSHRFSVTEIDHNAWMTSSAKGLHVSFKVCCFSLIHTVAIWEFHLAFSANAVHAAGVDFQSVGTDLSMSEAHRKHFPLTFETKVQYFDMKI